MNPQRRAWLKGLMASGVGPAGWASTGMRGPAGVLSALGVAGLPGCARGDAPLAHLPAQVQGGWVADVVAQGHAWRDARDGRQAAGKANAASGSEGPPASSPSGTWPVRRVHTLIIGAGVAGLSAARSLQQGGLDDFAVLDLDAQAGGNAQGHLLGGLPCPLGAHYLPMPGPDATEVAQWLEELGLIRMQQGQWVGDERHLCHSPQERLFVPDGAAFETVGPATSAATHPAAGAHAQAQGDSPSAHSTWLPGHWQEGLLPAAPPASAQSAAYQRFAHDVAAAARLGFAMPTHKRPWHPGLAVLDQQSFAQWLDARGHADPALRWLLDYACRDDYGAGLQRVSAWAGLQYFASRHGFAAPPERADANADADEPARDAVLTWPEGNGWLTQQLAHGLGGRWHAGQMALSVEAARHEVAVQAWSTTAGQGTVWLAQQVVLAVPLMVAQRLLRTPLAPLQALVPHLAYAPWLVSNLLLREPLISRPGAPLAWDNVPYTSQGVAGVPMPSLGYVDARHQSLAAVPTGPMLLTHYWALGGQSAAQGRHMRQQLLQRSWQDWALAVCQDLARIHPDLPGKLERIDLKRYGHAMLIPTPGLRGHAGLSALQSAQGRLHFAHSDLSAYSVFEEAFTHGVRAAREVLLAAGLPHRSATP
jgi:monoamine oxidase